MKMPHSITLRAAFSLPVAASVALLLSSPGARAADGTWIRTNQTSPNYSTTSSWASSIVASGSGAIANFNTVNLTTDINLNNIGTLTLGHMIFGDTSVSNHGWGMSTGTLTLAGGSTPTITVNNLGTAAASINVVTSGTQGLEKLGVGRLVLNAANTYTGLTTVSAGTLAYNLNNAISTGGITVNGATAILSLGAFTDTVGTLTVSGGGSITGSGTLTSTGTFEMQSGSASAILAGSGIALNKTTGGTATLTGANTYSGTTTVSAGTLVLSGSGSIANSATVDVQLGATLDTSGVSGGTYTYGTGQTVKGKGTITGKSVIQGTLAAGNSPGLLTFSNDLTLASTTNSVFEIQNTGTVRGTDYDGVNVATLLTYDGTLTLTLTTLVANGTYDLFNFGSVAGNFDSVVFSGGTYAGTFTINSGIWSATDTNGSGQTFRFDQATGDLIISAIPEPSAALLLTGGLMAIFLFRRRRV